MSQQFKWCYSPATERAWTARHDWHMLCQRHYEDVRAFDTFEALQSEQQTSEKQGKP